VAFLANAARRDAREDDQSAPDSVQAIRLAQEFSRRKLDRVALKK
jgi:hypothetical protein